MRKLRNTLAVVSAVVTLGGAAAWLIVRPWWQRWGVDPDEAARELPGDEILSDPTVSETRAITIAAAPARIWPWLLQMGYGRGGWYSYDLVDMRGPSADRVQPEHQDLKVGDIVPTHPGGGFEVRVVEPEHALVLYSDTALVRSQAEATAAAAPGSLERTPANVQAAGTFLGGAQPSDFAASWAFVLEPLGGGRSRLIERFRARFTGGEKPWMRVTMPILGFGLFAMMRRQLLGIRDRVERAEDVGRSAG